MSLAVHGAVLLALMRTVATSPPPPRSPEPVGVSLAPPPPAPRPAQPAAATAPKATATPAKAAAREAGGQRPAVRPRTPSPLPAAAQGHADGPAKGDDEAIGEAELAGAAMAGSGGGGGGGGGCDLAARLQAALRTDRQVRAELAAVAPGGRALRVWNGDWVAHAGQDGRGLAAVREVILWEVGFSPPQCKREQVHGLVLLVVPAATGGDVRLALGTGAWRWSDLLGLDAARQPG